MAEATQAELDTTDEAINSWVESFDEKAERLAEISQAVSGAVAGAFDNLSNRLVESLGLASTGFEGFIKGLVQVITKLISMMLAQSIAQSIAGATASGTATGPAAIFTTPAFIATAVGGVLAAFAAIPKFADGGIVSGPTYALVGEYAGAKNNPEVIAPLDKLKDLIQPNGSGAVIVGGKIEASGDILRVILDRADKSRNRRG